MHMVVVHAPVSNVGVPWKPTLHTHVPGPPVASPVQVACLSARAKAGFGVNSLAGFVVCRHAISRLRAHTHSRRSHL